MIRVRSDFLADLLELRDFIKLIVDVSDIDDFLFLHDFIFESFSDSFYLLLLQEFLIVKYAELVGKLPEGCSLNDVL